jgi:hypothetical protein
MSDYTVLSTSCVRKRICFIWVSIIVLIDVETCGVTLHVCAHLAQRFMYAHTLTEEKNTFAHTFAHTQVILYNIQRLGAPPSCECNDSILSKSSLRKCEFTLTQQLPLWAISTRVTGLVPPSQSSQSRSSKRIPHPEKEKPEMFSFNLQRWKQVRDTILKLTYAQCCANKFIQLIPLCVYVCTVLLHHQVMYAWC